MDPRPADKDTTAVRDLCQRLGGRRFIFIVGSIRSGTTWLHRMLAEHPQVATHSQELTVFSDYLAPAMRSYQRESVDEAHLHHGMPVLLDPTAFHNGLCAVAAELYGRVVALNPGATVVLDKRPDYGHHIPLIERLAPGSRFIHIIRDGRDVAVSMQGIRQRRNAGPKDFDAAVKAWHDGVVLARRHGRDLPRGQYLEVRYEDLVEHTGQGMREILAFCGLPTEETMLRDIVAKYHMGNKLVSAGDKDLNALRGKRDAIWRVRLTLEQRYRFDRKAGHLLAELGYAKPGWWSLSPGDRVRMALYNGRIRAGLFRRALRNTFSAPLHRPLSR